MTATGIAKKEDDIKLEKGRKDNTGARRSILRSSYRPIISVAVISLLLCGVFFPLFVTGVGQVLFPYQSNGELVQLNGRTVGSYLINNNFTLPIFFHARPANESASGVDPDITLQDAYSQVARINAATGIPSGALNQTIQQNVEGVYWIFGSPYVNVLRLNLALINEYPSVYSNFTNLAP
ncbi:MAG TPA: potassium-transporting ATPase subunit C [Nitrososphaerales archaeon]|nr:potassium-transporting ATPase subunit C [Nitrososphaerales archaeon]